MTAAVAAVAAAVMVVIRNEGLYGTVIAAWAGGFKGI